MGFTFYADRFDTDDLLYRLLIFVGMLGVAALATTLPAALHGGRGFVLSYVFVRLVLLVLYARAIRHVDEGRAIAVLLLRRLLGRRASSGSSRSSSRRLSATGSGGSPSRSSSPRRSSAGG